MFSFMNSDQGGDMFWLDGATAVVSSVLRCFTTQVRPAKCFKCHTSTRRVAAGILTAAAGRFARGCDRQIQAARDVASRAALRF